MAESSISLCLSLHQSISQTTKNVFLICTYGGRPVFKSIEQVIAYKHDNIVGRFSCKGFDTFGPFKLIGGESKGHPDEKDIAAVEFYNGLTEQPVFLK